MQAGPPRPLGINLGFVALEAQAPLLDAVNRVVARALAIEGAEPTPTTPQAFAQLIASEIPRWGQVIKRGNVKAD